MATIIDSLVVRLGLDSKEFDGGQRKVSQSLKTTSKDAESAAKSVGQFLAVIGGVYAIKRFVESTIEASAALDRMSKNLGMNVQDLSAWSRAAEIAGGTGKGLQGTFDMLSKAQTELRLTGESGLIPYFSALGISMASAGQARPVADMMLDMADRFSKMDRTTAFNMGQMMGVDEGTMNLLLRGRAEVELMIKRQKEHGAVTKKQAEEASRMREGIVKIKQEFESFGRELLSKATPALEWLLQKFQEFSAWIRENQEFVSTFLKIVASGLMAIGLAATPVNLVILAVTALSAAIGLLYQDFQTWKRGGESFIDWGKWEPGFRMAGNAIKWLKDLMVDLVIRYAGLMNMISFDNIMKMMKGDFTLAEEAGRAIIEGSGKAYGTNGAYGYSADFMNSKPGSTGDMSSRNKSLAYFQAQGWTAAQSAGIVANLQSESNFNHKAVGDNGQAYGIAQWHPDRQAAFKAWAGKDIRMSSLEDQLAFVHWELTQGNERDAGNRLRQTTSARDAGRAVSQYYERPKDTEGELARRGSLASSIYMGIPGAGGAGAGAGSRPAGAGGINKSVQTHIGEVTINTQATDAVGIAIGIGTAITDITNQANYGVF